MELVLLVALVLVNGVFSMSEMAVVSSRKARLKRLADDGNRGAAAALALADDSTAFLATIQVGMTIIGITSGAFAEATLANRVSDWLGRWPATSAYASSLGSGLAIAFIAVLSVIVGELAPKRIALLDPEGIARIVARPMQLVSRAATPLVKALTAITEALVRLLPARPAEQPPVTKDEIEVMMDEGAEAGVFDAHEKHLVKRAFRLADLSVTGVMTPRDDVEFVDLARPPQENLARVAASHHSRFPVVEGGPDHVRGILFTRTLLSRAIAGAPPDFSDIAPALRVRQELSVSEVVETFREKQQSIAIVVDESGRTVGLATLNDVMEALVGDVAAVDEPGEPDVVQRGEGSWLFDGGVTAERAKDVLDLDEPLPGVEAGRYCTLAEFVAQTLGRPPRAGERIELDAVTLEVADLDGERVDKLIATRNRNERAAGDE